ncbi:MAG: NRDE family protein [Bacteroidetes bacterium]|nr:NRDE family protein [Bacteroidota bacterium]
MCTVTYIPSNDRVFITSNRDEKSWRFPAIPPQEYDFLSGKIYYPKDANAGGTWLAVHENGNAIVLLNGGFKFHESKPPYRKSRGLILLDLIEHMSPFDFFRSINLGEIEPFTLVIWQDMELFECRWDGEKKYAKQIDKSIPHIWSSVTLYNEEIAKKRKEWFDVWLNSNTSFSQKDILHFHQFTGDGDSHNNLTMNRDGKIFTVSITGIEIFNHKALITYLDLPVNKTYSCNIEFKKELAG